MLLFAGVARAYGWTHQQILETPFRVLLGYSYAIEMLEATEALGLLQVTHGDPKKTQQRLARTIAAWNQGVARQSGREAFLRGAHLGEVKVLSKEEMAELFAKGPNSQG